MGRPRQQLEASVALTPTVIKPEVDAGGVLSGLEELGSSRAQRRRRPLSSSPAVHPSGSAGHLANGGSCAKLNELRLRPRLSLRGKDSAAGDKAAAASSPAPSFAAIAARRSWQGGSGVSMGRPAYLRGKAVLVCRSTSRSKARSVCRARL